MARRAAASILLASVAAATTLASCGQTTATQRCVDGICTITLSGNGAKLKVDGTGGHTLELVESGDGTARFRVDGSEGEVSRGVPVGFGNNATLTLTAIEAGKVQVTVDTTTAPEDAAIGNG